jgi:aconitase B
VCGEAQPSSASIACIIARRLNTKSHSEPPLCRQNTAELAATYRYMSFDQIQDYRDVADAVAV